MAGTAQAAGPATAISLSLSPSTMVADGTSTTTATVTVTDNSVPPVGVAGEHVVVTSTDPAQKIGTVTDAGNGTYTATITSSTSVGTAMISVTDGTLSTMQTLTQTAGPPAKVAVSLNPSSIVADGLSTSTATATVTDAQGRVLPNQTVSFSSSDTGEAITESGNTAQITSSTTPGTVTITATDRGVSGTATLTQTADPPAHVAVSLNPSSIVADGISSTTARATVIDAHGRGLPAEAVVFSSSDSGDKVGATTNVGGGTYTAAITSSTTAGTPTITATDGGVSGTATLTQTVGPPAKVAVSLNPSSIVADGLSTSTATATVTDAQGRVLPNQTVSFSSSDTGEAITESGNTAEITSSTTPGTVTITATDGTASGTATLTQAVGPPAAIKVQVSPGAIVANASSTATATATVTDAQGHRVPTDTIAFSSSDPGQFFGPVSNHGDGTYSAEVRSSTTVGAATITATDPSHVSGQTTLTQAAGPSNLSLVANPSAAVTNQEVTLFAVVTASTGSPSGTITFENGTTPVAGCFGVQITPSNPGASCQTSFSASTSPERLTAVFTPGPTSTAPGATGSTVIGVRQDSPSVTLAIAGSVQVSQRTTYSAVVTAPGARPGPVLPSGSVAFLDNGQPVATCASQPLANGTATCSLTYKAVGKHTISARYSGDANFSGSGSAPHTVSVVPVPVRVLGTVGSTMQWSFYFTRSYTTVLALNVKGASAAASVLVKCHGRGCPFATHVAVLAKPKHCGQKGRPKCPTSGTVNLGRAFKKHHLHRGVTLTVSIRRPSWIGKYYMFTIRSGGPPRVQISCLAPGSTRPGVGC